MMRLTFRVAVSESARETAAEQLDGRRVHRVVERDRDRPLRGRGTDADVDGPTVLFIGRHEPRKGLAVLLDAWAELDRDAGSGSSASARRPRSCSAARSANVEWLGTHHRRASATRCCGAPTVFCAPSLRGESFGVVLLEAMAAGTPIVASAIEGYQNVARSGPGRAARRRRATPTRCATRCARLLDDAALRARLVASGQRAGRAVLDDAPRRALPRALRPRALVPADARHEASRRARPGG